MAEFKQIVITTKGKSLISKLILGEQTRLTRIVVSDRVYEDLQIEELTSISDVKQEVPIEKILRINDASIRLQASMSNEALTEGYFMNTVGIYAIDPDEGEILYSVIKAKVSSWVPPYMGSSISSCIFNITLAIGNADNVNIELNTNIASVADVVDLQEQLDIEKQKNDILMQLVDNALFTINPSELFKKLEALNKTDQSIKSVEESEE